MACHVHAFICRTDNYGVLIHDPATRATAAIDVPDGEAVLRELDAKGWSLTDILITHKHEDHIAGIPAVKARFPKVRIVGPKAEADAIGALDARLSEGDDVRVGGLTARVLATPGHTKGHIVYHFVEEDWLFAGDTLFALGCGRVLETDMDTMYESLMKLAALPGETRVHCGHEYTLANAKFAAPMEPGNGMLQDRLKEVGEQRAKGEMTLPTTLALECATNPFLRGESIEIAKVLGMADADPAAVFAELRERKNRA